MYEMKLGMMILLLSVLVGLIPGATSWSWTTDWPWTDYYSCWSNCGYEFSSCSCSSSCEYYGNCCYDYADYCSYVTYDPLVPTGVPGSCGGYYTQPSGEFSSPQFPGYYPNYADCSWRIQSTGTKTIRLTYTYVRIEPSDDCIYDAIRVYDGPSTCNPLLVTLCGTQTGTYTSSGNDLTVVFSSDDIINDQGFVASWVFEDSPSCRWNCGYNLGTCDCSSSCQYYGNCCYDYYDYCGSTTHSPGGAPCGGDLTDSSGEFFSPEFPNYYPNNADCTWRLVASEGQTIDVTFTFVELEECCDSISVYDGYYSYYPLLGRLPQDQIYHFNSSGSDLTVVFSTDFSVTRRGFRAEWMFTGGATCGGDLTDSSGEFFSPQYPNNYPDNADCTWRLLAAQGQTIDVTFTFVELEECCDSITVYDGPYSYYPLLGRLPQDQIYHFSSSSSDLTVVFSTDGSVTRQGFRAEWMFTGGVTCGGDLTDSSGEFFSPQYPNNYPDNADCTWRLLAAQGQTIDVTFTFVDLEECCDSITVYDGPYSYYPLLGRLPQDQIYHFSSSSSDLTVVFSTDGSVTRQGFRAEWMFTGGVTCGGDLTDSSGEFFSPQYPNNYPDNADCTWRLLASKGQTIDVTFTFVDLEECCDSITVYDGPYSYYPLLGRLPQDQIYHFSSSSSDLTVVFSTDGSVTRQGFRAEWMFTGGATCGGDLTDSSGEFFSPQYPNNYPDNADCTWRLLASQGQTIDVTFTFVDLEECCDSITVYDGPYSYYPLLGRLPQDQIYHFSSSSSDLTVVFSTDGSVTRQGFRAEWMFTGGAPCGGDLTDSSGEFFSPQYPNNYPDNADCTWRLLAAQGQTIDVTFTFVDLETCCDSITVYDGPYSYYPLLGRLPQDQIYHFSSSSSDLTVVFSTDGSVTRQGFRAEWMFTGGAPCGGDLTDSSGEFFSPQYPNNYPDNADCTWRLLAAQGQTIDVTFTFVELEECCDSITVYDGPYSYYPLLGRLPQDQIYHFSSSSSDLTVVFSTDGSVTRQGFRAEWMFTGGAPCGGDLTDSSGEFFSPQYPNNYPDNADCTWRLLAAQGQTIDVTFTFVDLEECCDSITVYDGPYSYYPLLGRLPQDQIYHFSSSSSDLTVVFSTDGSVTRQGFRAEWMFTGGASCGGDLTDSSGEFFSPQYPNNYPDNADCTWRLLAAQGQTIDVTFTFVELEECCDSITVYDGPYSYYPLLGRLPQDQIYHFSSSSSDLTVVFSTDGSVTRQGFRAEWMFTGGAPCGGDLTDSSGEFFSPQYPNNYPDNADCTWRLLAPEEQGVYVTFTFVDLEECCDSINVYDGPSEYYPLLGSVAQDQTYDYFISSGTYLTILFSSDHSVTRQGFRAEWFFSGPRSAVQAEKEK